MGEQVRVSSVDALEAFRAEMIRFVERARVALEDAEGEVRRMRMWLDQEQWNHWANEYKKRTKVLDQAEAELYNATITRPKESHAFHKQTVAKARRNLLEAEEKLRVLKRWRQNFENRSSPLLRQLDPMWFVVTRQLPEGIRVLGEVVKTLQAYAENPGIQPGPATLDSAGKSQPEPPAEPTEP